MEIRARYAFGSITAIIKLNGIVGIKPISFKLIIHNGGGVVVKRYQTIKDAIGGSLTYGCFADKWVIETV